jgi:DNA-binding response OmpR family regulator
VKLQVGHLRLVEQVLYVGNDAEPVKLYPKEAQLLAFLMQHPGEVVSRRTLMQEVWETEYLGDTRTLDVHICWLRQKIEDDPRVPEIILTRRGQGYELRI